MFYSFELYSSYGRKSFCNNIHVSHEILSSVWRSLPLWMWPTASIIAYYILTEKGNRTTANNSYLWIKHFYLRVAFKFRFYSRICGTLPKESLFSINNQFKINTVLDHCDKKVKFIHFNYILSSCFTRNCVKCKTINDIKIWCIVTKISTNMNSIVRSMHVAY